ncbi:MAG: nucleoside-diphosphate kinase [Nanoarchaeota archaeon]|nr:nucleoside-diphosphate kinase [Nanoarchaeota archaeon]MBU4352198.1 nucleoside-diphosphate kinase [Nanoarchaeota archaeon]MBU4456432.1 nucleoside-diphosphate kinase [Nanoarchaeota archaeon]MCG2719598.1 nucleoside-diphosphate kinase [Nanoarchaeota archaeon]
MIERTLVLVKPDGVQRGLIGDIISRFEKRGLKIVGMKMVWVDKDFSKQHYSAHIDKNFYKGLEDFIISAPIVAMAVEGINAVELVRKVVGSTEPKSAPIGTIRGDFAHVSYEYADKKGISIKNLVHASGNSEEAEQEVSLWFSVEELFNYKSANQDYVM